MNTASIPRPCSTIIRRPACRKAVFRTGYVATQEERTAFMMQIPSPNPENANSDLPKFDPIYYYNNYPDVAAVIGPDAVGLLNHYFAYGYSEGRLPYYGAEPCTDVQTSF